MSRNKKTILIMARFLTAVFLFVLISSPLSALAAGESASDNDTDEEYEDWSDAFNDSDYTDNLAENVASTFASYFQSYVGTRAEVIDEVANYIGESYDRTVSLYENVYQYVLPYAQTSVTNFDGANLSTSVYGKPVRNKNNLKLINTLQNDLKQSLPTNFVNIADSKHKTGNEMQFSDFPSIYKFANHPFNSSTIDNFSGTLNNCIWWAGVNNRDNLWDLFCPQTTDYEYVIYDIGWLNGVTTSYATMGLNCSPWVYRYSFYNSWTVSSNQNYISKYMGYGGGDIFIFGSGYIQFKYARDSYKTYFWNQETKTLYYLGLGGASNYIGTTSSDTSNTFTFDIINSVDFDDYSDLINQLILDVNMENNITNSLLIEILNELKNQRDVYQPTSDDDDIYDYIDYMMNKMLEVKDIHIEIPDLSPDMGGIVDGITALLNFLASIIRAIGNIVSSLLEGLLHLFVPTDAEWDEISVDFAPLTIPFSWIKDFFIEGTSAISTCLFGENVFDFGDDAETEELENVGASSRSNTGEMVNDIMYNSDGAPKIPVHFSNSSSELFNNIEDAYIIDMSWYTPYKPVGDMIVVAFCWIWFIWRVLHDIPGILAGASGIFDNEADTYGSYAEMESAEGEKYRAAKGLFGGNPKGALRGSYSNSRSWDRYYERKGMK